jgi:hypothetical protein
MKKKRLSILLLRAIINSNLELVEAPLKKIRSKKISQLPQLEKTKDTKNEHSTQARLGLQ